MYIIDLQTKPVKCQGWFYGINCGRMILRH